MLQIKSYETMSQLNDPNTALVVQREFGCHHVCPLNKVLTLLYLPYPAQVNFLRQSVSGNNPPMSRSIVEDL